MADFPDHASLEQMHLTPVVHSLEDIPRAKGPYHLKIDSGMGRLGTRAVPDVVVRGRGCRSGTTGKGS